MINTPIYRGKAQSDIDMAGFDLLNWSGGGGGGGGFQYDVTQYGATGDGTTDDTTAIRAALAAIPSTGGLLYFPAGHYKYTGATLLLDKPVTVMGDGGAWGGLSKLLTYADCTPAISTIFYTSTTLPLFTVKSDACAFKAIELLNTSVATPTAGSCGVYVPYTVGAAYHGDFLVFRDFTVSGFYINIDKEVGASTLFENCSFVDPVLYGVRDNNFHNGDLGDHCMANCWFFAGASNPPAALYGMLEGMKVINCKFNAGLGGLYGNMIEVNAQGATGDLFVTACGFENFTGTAIKGRNTSGAPYYNTLITGCQIGPITGGQIGIDFSGDFRDLVLNGNWGFSGGSPQPFITLTGVGNIALTGNAAMGYSSVISIGAGCSFAEAPVYIGIDARLVSITGGAKLQVRNPSTGVWADGDQWTNP
jgi:Pectate lyase superfamily protein